MTDSPCNNICVMDGEECIGCGRTLAEITNWQQMTDEEKQAVIKQLEDSDS